MHALFFANGNTAFFDESGAQVPELQRSWLQMYVIFLKEHGVDPTKVDYTLPNGSHAAAFTTRDGDFLIRGR